MIPLRGDSLRTTAIFKPVLTPSPLRTQNDVIVTYCYDVTVTNSDHIWPTPPSPQAAFVLKECPQRRQKLKAFPQISTIHLKCNPKEAFKSKFVKNEENIKSITKNL